MLPGEWAAFAFQLVVAENSLILPVSFVRLRRRNGYDRRAVHEVVPSDVTTEGHARLR
jgi:hypothetical protein